MKKSITFCFYLFSITSWAQVTVSTITSEFKGSGALALDSLGNLHIADFGDSLGGPDADGIPNNILQLDTGLNLTTFSTGFIGASGNNFDNSGVLYQSDIWDNAIYKIVDGVRTFVTSDGIVSPVGIVFDSSDNFYVCNCGNNTIQKVTPSGVSSIFSSGGFYACPNGITIDEDDNLYITNFTNGNIIRLDMSGNASIIANSAAGNGHIEYDPNTRNLYVASFGGQQIFYIDIDDPEAIPLVGLAGVRGNEDGTSDVATFSNPNGIAVSKTGDSIYVNSALPVTGGALNPQYIRLITNVLSLSVEDNELLQNLKVYPNPAAAYFVIEADLLDTFDDLHLIVRDLSGRIVIEMEGMEMTSNVLKTSVDISGLSAGNYFYSMSNGKQHLFTGQMVKQ
ncbi:MAG: T9SS type A sorting domain-containing protein [Bacteroidota bacterium]